MLIGRTLGTYLAAKFFKVILAVFLTVFILVYTLDFVELMRRAGETPGASSVVMARLALFRTPSVAELVLPFAVLFGSIATLLQLSRKLELVIARSAGLSAWQFLQPALLIAVLIGVFSVTVYNPGSAMLKQKASEIEARVFAKSLLIGGKDLWLRQKSVDGQAVIRAEGIIENTTTLTSVSIFTFDDKGGFQERIEADEAQLREGYWDLKNVRVLSAYDEPQTYDEYLIASTLEASQVRQSFTSPDSVPFWELPSVINRTITAGLDATRYEIHYQSLLARPLLLIAMVFVAASVSLRFFRFGGVAKMVLGGIIAGFVLYVLQQIMEDLGAAGFVRPIIAAWFPAVVGTLLGILAVLYQEDG
ncbi:LPS export ABC transporter permease LptG [Microvirga sp. W0021]|uniref:LPS export ABC transporter permease LptG n=1 Tax=Hohaiivirga grylli TaxID=3133970 RepID=A0ABV0BHU7_9HYPH